MPTKIEAYTALAAQTAAKITTDFTTWTGFLALVARLYKYTFREQLLIYAQRPQATSCAEYSTWTEQMHRYVRRAAKGIAIVREIDGVPTLRYMFDIADTGLTDDGLHLYFWTAQDEFVPVIAAAKEQERKFADVALWVLSQTSVSINLIQKECSIGNKYAQEFFEKLRAFGVIGEVIERGRREVCPQSIGEVPSKLKEILSCYGISDDEIVAAISKKVGQ